LVFEFTKHYMLMKLFWL